MQFQRRIIQWRTFQWRTISGGCFIKEHWKVLLCVMFQSIIGTNRFAKFLDLYFNQIVKSKKGCSFLAQYRLSYWCPRDITNILLYSFTSLEQFCFWFPLQFFCICSVIHSFGFFDTLGDDFSSYSSVGKLKKWKSVGFFWEMSSYHPKHHAESELIQM